jgi:hypothetical protein
MLFDFIIWIDKDYSNKKKVNGKCNCWMILNINPGFLHFTAPMDIIHNKYGGSVGMVK